MMTVGMLLSVGTGNFAQGGSSSGTGCSLVDKKHPAQFISYESRDESASEITLRLHNNLDCGIIVETDDSYPTRLKRLSNGGMTIETVTDSQDGVRLRLHYLIHSLRRRQIEPAYGWGDSVYTYQILPGQSVIFTVPASHFKRGFDIAVPFNYSWESNTSIGMGAGGVVHRVYFLFDDLPPDALRGKR